VLAGALPAAAQPVTGYQQQCGPLFAVAADGLYRLAVGAEPRGLWERVPIPAHHRVAGGRLFWEDQTLRFFTADGVALTLSGFPCRAPASQ